MTDDLPAQRRQLRERMRQKRRELPPAQRVAAANTLAANLLSLPFAPASGYVAGYWAMDGEIALHTWQLNLPGECIYCLPVLDGERLGFSPWRPGDPLINNRYGIPEPAVSSGSLLRPQDLTLVVLPLVAFDLQGARLGMGGGWYDRSFAFRKDGAAPPWLVGAAFELQQQEAIEAAPWDVPLDAVCCETRSWDFRSASDLAGSRNSPSPDQEFP
ncbi:MULTISPECIES: 5-formyltetrahydrofolate cyclo-ligase [Lysobacteraceae]|uniref:5-formyltetrahydrofolate cyclo-ligase n=1 Tax=Novilysobacter avium TaxID=2781023 RepID=A0A7S6ZV23_9GAMM|nr:MULTISPECIES: 5-formyltetrahydrofolate cyclo-ligase [Lysobacter]QOW22595.1 5-formyltetrahydrofolate cyclo-ligase [Lysobacter avium]QOW25107.1 5-formyltetrahydrofolate cyclo-ligase [Lysobacter sp. H23M47]